MLDWLFLADWNSERLHISEFSVPEGFMCSAFVKMAGSFSPTSMKYCFYGLELLAGLAMPFNGSLPSLFFFL